MLNLGVGLKMQGKKVLLIDADPQGSLSISLGIKRPDELDISLATVMGNVIDNKPFDDDFGIIHCSESKKQYKIYFIQGYKGVNGRFEKGIRCCG